MGKIKSDFNKKNNALWNLENNRNWKINFPFKIINDLMAELINKIKSEFIIPIIENNKDIKTLIFSGGASSNPILFDMMKKESININYVKSPNPEVAIAFGSVLFSYDHFVISPRKSKYTFGIKVSDIWDEKIHKNKGIKVYDNIDKMYRCNNCFSKFITINDNLRPDQEICQKYILNNSIAPIKLYKTKRNNVTFVDENDEYGKLIVHKFGQFIIDVGNKYDISNREVEIKMKLGGTFISATAIYKKTGDNSKITCLYDYE